MISSFVFCEVLFLPSLLWKPFYGEKKILRKCHGFLCAIIISNTDGTNLLIFFSIKDPKKKLHENSYVILFLWNFPKSHVRKRACVPKHPSIYQQTSTSKLWRDRVMVVVEFLDKTPNTLYRLENMYKFWEKCNVIFLRIFWDRPQSNGL